MDGGSYESYDGYPEDDSLNPFQDEYPMDEGQEVLIKKEVNNIENEAEDDDDDNFDEANSRPNSKLSANQLEIETTESKDNEDPKEEKNETNSDDSDSDSDSEDDGVVVKIGDIKPTDIRRKGVVGKINIDGVPLVNGESIYDSDINNIEDKPWRKPGTDLSDYFNYGFIEETWNLYCERQRKLRLEYGNNQAQVNQVLFSQMNGTGNSNTSNVNTNSSGRQLVSLVGAENPHNNSNPTMNQNNRIIITTDLTKKGDTSQQQLPNDSEQQSNGNSVSMPIGMDFSKPPPMFDSSGVSKMDGNGDDMTNHDDGVSVKHENDNNGQTNNSNGNILPSQGSGIMMQSNNLPFNPMRPPPNLPNMFPNNFVKPPMFNNFIAPTFGGKQPLIRHPINSGNMMNSRGRFNDIGSDYESRSPRRDSSEDSSSRDRRRRSRSRSPSRKKYDRDRERDRRDRGKDDDRDRERKKEKDSDKHKESSRKSERDKYRDKEREKEKDKERDKHRDRERERERDRKRSRKDDPSDREKKRSRRHRKDSEETQS
uniref:Pre-mRNA 3'-end-processing factor FIP1 n=1 Tax=Parastrongyloides trichosuri TaxID=131310 RepID=A0A0N4ZNS0_PARTI